MSKKNPGGFISSTAVRTPDPTDQTQYSGVWSMPEQYQAAKAGDWANPSGQSYQIPGSLRFNNSAYLTRSFSTTGDRKRFTLSVWMKKSELAVHRENQNAIIDAYVDNNNRTTIYWGDSSSDILSIYSQLSGSINAYVAFDTSFNDLSAWFHLVFTIDTTLIGSNDRIRAYINGKEVNRTYNQNTFPSQNATLMYNYACDYAIGCQRYNGAVGPYYYNGYMTDFYVIDGQALTPDYFGYFDYNGIWQPKRYTGSYGTNGFYLKLGEEYNSFYSAAASGAGEFFVHTRNALGTNGGIYRRPGNDSAAYWNGTKITGDFDIYWKYGVGSGSVSPGDAYQIGVIDASYKNSFNYDNGILGGSASTVFYTQYGASGFYTRSFKNGASGDALTSGTNPGTTSYVRLSRSGDTISVHQGTTPGTWTLIKTFGETFSGDVYFFFGSGNKDQAVYIDPIVLHVINGQTDAHFITSADGIGGDSSGNLYPFQAIELFDTERFKDSPTDGSTTEDTGLGGQVASNYAILNQLASVGTYSNGGLQWTGQSSGDNCAVSTIGVKSGKWYWEVQPASLSNLGTNGVIYDPTYSDLTTSGGYTSPNGFAMDWASNPPLLKHSGTSTSYGTAITALTDTVMVALDLDNQKLYFGLNGTWFNSSNPATGTNAAVTSLATGKTWFAHVGDQWGSASSQWKINFGQRAFKYQAPSGFKCLNTANLPMPTILDGSKYMDVLLWTGSGGGSGATRDITGLKFQPDFIWEKARTSGSNHQLLDSVRGVGQGKVLASNSTGSEPTPANTETSYGWLSSINSDGFTVTNGSSTFDNWNKSGDFYVAWNWKAGGTPTQSTPYMRDGASFTPTHGNIVATRMSVNTKAGFSIVNYTGNGSSNQTVAHGLGVAPSFGILKDRDSNSNNNQWHVFHTSAGDKYGYLSAVNAFATTAEFYPTSGSSDTVTIGRSSPVANSNESGDRYVMYLFSQVDGYSAFGSFTVNGSTNGPFVYTGFKPKFVLLKNNGASTWDWVIVDTARKIYNPRNSYLFPNLALTEGNTYTMLDALSNGFRVKTTWGLINSEGPVYYVAFAENPFKISRAE